MAQKLIDTDLLIAYQTADPASKRMLENIYGIDTFNIYNHSLEFFMHAMMTKHQESGIIYEYPYMWKDKKFTCYSLVLPSEFRGDISSVKGDWEKLVNDVRLIYENKKRASNK